MELEIVTKDGRCTLTVRHAGETLLELFQENGIMQIPSPCGGNGTCGKCRVQVEGRGEVLACRTEAEAGMTVCLEEEKASAIAEAGNCHLYPADGSRALAAACDIGTTTVVCHLLDGKTGERLGTVSAPNAQRIYGADVISRIQASKGEGLSRLQGAAAGQINGMLRELVRKTGRKEKIDLLAVAGNTVMSHLFAGISPESIGMAPFRPLSRFGDIRQAEKIGIENCREVYISPAVAGYVGGDITADLLAVQMDTAGKETLLLDIGTNAEMVLGKDGDYVCCAAAAGPAFEGAEITMGMPAAVGAVSHVWMDGSKMRVSVIGGGEPDGICGSGLIDALAVFLKTGLMDETGRLTDEDEVEEEMAAYQGEDENGNCVYLTEKIRVTQADVRKLQLAKAAVAAGIRILLDEKKMDIGDIGQVILAGGFGSFLDKRSAAAVGLIPEELLGVTVSVGNAAGEGAVSAAISGQARRDLARIQNEMKYIELSANKKFSEKFMEQMFF